MSVSGVSSRARATGGRSSATPVPLVVGIAALLVSVVVAVVAIVATSAPVQILGITLPIVAADHWWISVFGYVVTPILTVVCFGWDMAGQRKGPQQNVNFVRKPAYHTALRWIMIAGFVVGLWHIINLSVALSDLWGWA